MIIYKATNKKNGKVYIGCTNQGLDKRKANHLSSSRKGSHLVFHKAILKHGEESFTWEIIDEANSINELYEKEIYWIQEYDSYSTGYNMTLGGDVGNGLYGETSPTAVINDSVALTIGKLIKESSLTYSEIAQELSVSIHIVRLIGCGRSWKHLFEQAPALSRPQAVMIDEETAKEIIELIKTTTMTYREIAIETGTTEGNVTNIAHWKSWKHLSDTKPCLSRPHGTKCGQIKSRITEEKAKEVVKLLLETKLSLKKISEKTGVVYSTVVNINQGKAWKELYDTPPYQQNPRRKPKKKSA